VPALTRHLGSSRVALVALLALPLLLSACHRKATQTQCDAILDRYAELLTKEHFPDASPSAIDAEKKREREESRGDDDFRNCTSEVEESDFQCAMKAATADALERCLE
jgi:hypothetical protein